ncbi:MAG: chromate transporter [Kiritimatiellia bacterium]|jgi:chromate transporter
MSYTPSRESVDKPADKATEPVISANVETAPTVTEAFRVWLSIGLLSFGGPAAQIALIHREVVDKRRWLSEVQFLNALNFCMLLPGPEAMQLVTYTGWRLNGYLGGLVAGVLFVLPGALVMIALAALYISFGDISVVETFFLGIKATVVVIVIQALLRVSKKALTSKIHYAIAIAAFIGIFFLNIAYPFIILGAAIVGSVFLGKAVEYSPQAGLRPSLKKTLKTLVIGLVIWWLPIFMLDYWVDIAILSDMARFFSTLAVVTFGGAYSVLAYMAQDVVAIKGWLTTGEMMTGLGLAETTPGPLILVTEFVGFFGAYREGGWYLGLAGAAVTLWVTFVPCFLWIFTGGPYIDWLSSQPRLRGALSAITAAVVGVMLSLSIWFALHVFFKQIDQVQWSGLGVAVTLWQPDLSSLHPGVVALVILGAYLLLKRQWSVLAVLGISSATAVFTSLLFYP